MKTSREFFSKVIPKLITLKHNLSTSACPVVHLKHLCCVLHLVFRYLVWLILFDQVSKQFGTMPFNLRSMDDEKKVNLSCYTVISFRCWFGGQLINTWNLGEGAVKRNTPLINIFCDIWTMSVALWLFCIEGLLCHKCHKWQLFVCSGTNGCSRVCHPQTHRSLPSALWQGT